MKRYMKTGLADLLYRHIGHRALAAPLVALFCAAATGNSTASDLTRTSSFLPTAQDLIVVAAANVRTRIVLQGSDPNGLPLTFKVDPFPAHGTLDFLDLTASNLSYVPDQDFLGADSFTYVVSNGTFTSLPAKVSITVKKGLWIGGETIFNDSTSVAEGNSGRTLARFTVTMTMPGSDLDLVKVSYRTIDGTAKAESDYVATSNTLFFAENTTQTITVTVIGDTGFEADENFLVQLSDLSANAVFVIPNLTPAFIGLQTTTQASVSARGTIRNDDLNVVCCLVAVGEAQLTPENSEVSVGEPVDLALTWTHPVGWRKLNSLDLLLVDDEGEVLVTRWHEAENSFSLFNQAAGRFLRTSVAGSPRRFETSAATLFLQESTGGGPPGQTVTINYSLSFKPQAAGRTFSVEAFATDDAGNEQGFESVGTITVLPR